MVRDVIRVFKKLAEHDRLILNAKDVVKLKKVIALKKQIKVLESELEPRIEATFEEYGKRHIQIGKEVIKLSRQCRNSVSWKSLANHVIKSHIIQRYLRRFTNEYTYYYAKPVGTADEFKTKPVRGGITKI